MTKQYLDQTSKAEQDYLKDNVSTKEQQQVDVNRAGGFAQAMNKIDNTKTEVNTD